MTVPESIGELLDTYRRTEDPDVLRHAVRELRKAVAAPQARDTLFFQLTGALYTLFLRTGETELLTEAVETGRAARGRAAAAGLPSHVALLSNLGAALEELHQRQGGTHLLAEAVEANREAVLRSGDEDPRRPGRMANLCNSLHSLYGEDTRERAALDEAVMVGRAAETLTQDRRDPLRAIVTGNLQNALVSLFVRTGDHGVADEAIAMGQATIAAFHADDPRRAVALSNHGSALRALAARTGDRTLTHAAVAAAREAVETAGDDRLDRIVCLSGLAASLRLLYSDTGEDACLEEYVRHTVAVAREASSGPMGVTALADLCLALRLRHDRDGDLQSLLSAVEAGRRALAATTQGRADRVTVINRLVNALHMLSTYEQDPAPLAEAITLARLAVSSCPPDHPHYAGNLYDLARLLLDAARSGADPAGAREALGICRSAVAALDEDDPDLAAALLILSQALCEVGTKEAAADASSLAPFEEAVAAARRAVALLPEESTLMSSAVRTLGQALFTLGSAHPRPELGRAALEAAHDGLMAGAVGRTGARVKDRIAAARLAGRAAHLAGHYTNAVAAFEQAVELLPRIAPRELFREDREAGLGSVAGLAAEAAGAATAAGRPGRALELLEQSRSLLQSELVGTRTAPDALARHDPSLAEEFRVLRSRTRAAQSVSHSSTAPGLDPALSDDAAARRQRELADDWAELLVRIRRSHDALSRFLLPPTLEELRAEAAEGPVVTVYAGPLRSDALVLHRRDDHPVEIVELPGLSWDQAMDMVVRLRSACTRIYGEPGYGGRRTAQGDLGKVLGDLWDTVVSPVLDACAMSVPPPEGTTLPRLWWCPVGIMAFLPLHAAERHDETGGGPSVLDRAVTSYTPTIGALAYARRATGAGGDTGTAEAPRADATSTEVSPERDALIVALPHTPGAPALYSAEEESDALRRLLPGATLLHGSDATRRAVMTAMGRCSVAHFICHGISDTRGRGYSRLLLHDHGTRPLTVADVWQLDLPHADLAYLSACETTGTAPRFVDEALHITAAFQTAGYRNVIGSLWKIQGSTGARIAAAVYARLTADGTRPPDVTEPARALHEAVVAVRARHPLSPGLWAAHAHFGR
ncbi:MULTISPECIES: CHAT domain-containing protein [unclassified Streptomyces]|uniref:CHAT domain-containing protein n=1 Tax=unclassified Streptomyces TaxID=2593676 RepID=UPI0035DC4E97